MTVIVQSTVLVNLEATWKRHLNANRDNGRAIAIEVLSREQQVLCVVFFCVILYVMYYICLYIIQETIFLSSVAYRKLNSKYSRNFFS